MPMGYDGFGPDAKVLILLLENGKMKRSYFQDKFGINYNTATAALKRLEEWGLVVYEAVGDRRDTVFWSLTAKGKRAAQMLADLDEFIRSD